MGFFSEDFFSLLIGDIKKSFAISNPIFLLNGARFKDEQGVVAWIDEVHHRGRWVKYKRIKDNIFELKEYFPDPSDACCLALINKLIAEVKASHQEGETIWYVYEGCAIKYNEKEIRKELLAELRMGYLGTYARLKENTIDVVYEIVISEGEFEREFFDGCRTIQQEVKPYDYV